MLAESQDRIQNERSMRRRRLRAYLDALRAITQSKRPIQRDAMHQKSGAAKKEAGRDARFVKLQIDYQRSGKNKPPPSATPSTDKSSAKPGAAKARVKPRGRVHAALRGYLLRTNMSDRDPVKLWQFYLQLTEVEQAFKEYPHKESTPRLASFPA